MDGGSAYPPTGRWHQLTRQEQRDRMETSADLLPVLEWHRGDPRLTAWEEGFLASMVQQIRAFHGAAKISRKQWDKIHAILEKVEQPPQETAEEETAEMEG